MLTTSEVEKVLEHFDVELSNFEIVNIEEKRGWSSRFLFLIIEHSEQFVLKGKSEEQLAGYLADIAISDFLKEKGFEAREAIKTKEGKYHFIDEEIHWDLKTYVPGSVENFAEYTDESVVSLAQINTSYINASLNNPEVKGLGLEVMDFLDIGVTLQGFAKYKDILCSVVGNEPEKFSEWFQFAQVEISKILGKQNDFSISHNDLNHKNILLDLHTNRVTSFIDWDHGCIATPLKDIVEPINMFYDFVPERYEHMRTIYLKKIAEGFGLRCSQAELNLLQVYFYALNKWKYMTFFAKLIDEVGDTSNELSMFEDVIRTQLDKVNNMGKLYRIL